MCSETWQKHKCTVKCDRDAQSTHAPNIIHVVWFMMKREPTLITNISRTAWHIHTSKECVLTIMSTSTTMLLMPELAEAKWKPSCSRILKKRDYDSRNNKSCKQALVIRLLSFYANIVYINKTKVKFTINILLNNNTHTSLKDIISMHLTDRISPVILHEYLYLILLNAYFSKFHKYISSLARFWSTKMRYQKQHS